MRLARASINKCASSGIIMEAYSEKLSSTSLSYDGRPGGEGTTGPTLLRCAFCHKLATELEVKLLEEGRAGERMSQLNESSEQLASGQTQDPASLIDSMTPSLSEINTEELQRYSVLCLLPTCTIILCTPALSLSLSIPSPVLYSSCRHVDQLLPHPLLPIKELNSSPFTAV